MSTYLITNHSVTEHVETKQFPKKREGNSFLIYCLGMLLPPFRPISPPNNIVLSARIAVVLPSKEYYSSNMTERRA